MQEITRGKQLNLDPLFVHAGKYRVQDFMNLRNKGLSKSEALLWAVVLFNKTSMKADKPLKGVRL